MSTRTGAPSVLGQRVQQTRRSRQLTQAALAQRAGIDRQTLGAIERDERGSNPTLRVLVSLCDALDVSLADLFFLDQGAV